MSNCYCRTFLLTPFHHHYTEKSALCYCITEKRKEQTIKGDKMKNFDGKQIIVKILKFNK